MLVSQEPYEADDSFLILQMGKMRHRKGDSFAQGHTASEWQRWDSVSGSQVLYPYNHYSTLLLMKGAISWMVTPRHGNEVPPE